MKPTLLLLALACLQLAACASSAARQTIENDEYVESEEVIGSHIARKQTVKKMTPEERQALQDAINRGSRPMDIK